MLGFLLPSYILALVVSYYSLIALGIAQPLVAVATALASLPLAYILSWLFQQIFAWANTQRSQEIEVPWWVEAEAQARREEEGVRETTLKT